jgi:carbamate kinase
LKKLVVVALGGNAIKKADETFDAKVQLRNIENACTQILQVVKKDYRVVITHGNGPQVGNLLIQQEIAKKVVPRQPLDVHVARTQGQIGYMLQRTLYNKLAEENLDIPVITVLTQVLVNQHDPAFKNPSKPVGPFYSETEARDLAKLRKYIVKEVQPSSSKPFRRVVPSPQPMEILEKKTLKLLVDSDCIVIAAGGGGIPVIKPKAKIEHLDGIEAVIDKDLAAEVLAETLHADILLILTDVEKVKLNYNKPNEMDLDKINLNEAIKYQEKGHFLTGSMGPKVDACIRFLQWGGEKAIITSLEKASQTLDGKGGTVFYRRKIPMLIKNNK